MAGVWMGFMMIVLVIWALWLNQDSELRHPKSEQRAKASLALVTVIGFVSLIACLAIQFGMKGGAV